jgi:hypothetical protein
LGTQGRSSQCAATRVWSGKYKGLKCLSEDSVPWIRAKGRAGQVVFESSAMQIGFLPRASKGQEKTHRQIHRRVTECRRCRNCVFAELPCLDACFVCLGVSSSGMTKEEHQAERADVQSCCEKSRKLSPISARTGPFSRMHRLQFRCRIRGNRRELRARFRCGVFYGIKSPDKRYANSGHQVR